MVQPPSPISYFNKAMFDRQHMLGRGAQLSRLELSVISCFGAVQETAIHTAAAAVNGGIGQVEVYLLLMHETLAHLRSFLISLALAPSYGAYAWPNSELRAVADSLAELGIHMKYPQTTIACGSNGSNGRVAFPPQSSQLPAVGVALVQTAQDMRKFASQTYFFSEDLTPAFNEGWRRLTHAEDILNALFRHALSAKALEERYRPRASELVSLAMNRRPVNYRQFSGSHQ